MPYVFVCPSGHKWESVAADVPNRGAICPTCGESGLSSTVNDSCAVEAATGLHEPSPPSSPANGRRDPTSEDDPLLTAALTSTTGRDASKVELQEVPGHEVLGELGRGGMGVVLLGQDVEFDRALAVKVLLEKHCGNDRLASRFLEEAKITGQLQHPGIAPVHRRGTLADGRPYFTMKLIQGRTLADLLKERKEPSEDLPRYLAVFAHVCNTLAYAHARGVIHRDLKPANIMVGEFGEVQVMDWGLAKVLRQHDDSNGNAPAAKLQIGRFDGMEQETQAGDVVGTLAFMPPEQARGEIDKIDRQSDVFGLGGILCVILTGQPPYSANKENVFQQASRGDLTDAMARLRACNADAELIGLAQRCLAADKDQRPRDAGAVSHALEAYQEGVRERLRRAELERAAARVKAAEERKRRRVKMALAGATLLLLIAGGSAWIWYRHDREARQTETAIAVNVGLTKAEYLRDEAERMPSRSTVEAAAAVAAWRQADEALGQAEAALKAGAADDALRQRVWTLRAGIDGRRQQLQRKAQLFENLDDARLARLALDRSWLDLVSSNKKYTDAFAKYGYDVAGTSANELANQIADEETDVREAMLVGLNDWWLSQGASSKKLLTLMQAADTDPWRTRFRTALAANEVQVLRQLSAEARRLSLPAPNLNLLAIMLKTRGERQEALALLRWARTRHPTDLWSHFELGYTLSEQKDLSPVELEEQTGCFRTVLALRPASPLLHVILASDLIQRKQYDEAVAESRMAIDVDPKSAMAWSQLGYVFLCNNQLEDAMVEFRKAIDLDPNYAPVYVHLGNTLRAKKEWDAAIAAHRKVIELAPASPVGHYSLGISYAAKNQWNDAITAYQKAIELDPKLLGPHFGLGNAFAAKNQWNNAIAAYRQEIELDPKLPGPRVSLGNALNVKNQWDAAIVEFRKAIELDPISTSQHIGLGNALRWKNQVEAAAAEYRKAIELDPKLPLAYFNLAQLLRVHQRWKESIAPYRKAIELDPNHRDAHFGLGESLVKMGSFAQAKACIQLLQKLTPENDPDQERRRWLIQQVRRCDRGLEVEAKIPSILAGKLTMARGPEWREVVEICISQERYVTGAKIYELAFRAVPQMMDNLAIGHRYDAARLCAEAAAGEGVDAGKLDEKERAELRKQAIHWLRSELGSWDKFVASGNPNDRKLAREKLTERLRVPDLASIRDKDQLAKLSVDEREACEKLWRDVAALLKKLDE